MDSYSSLLYASVGGTVELLTLCFAGALLSYLKHWSGTISAALSNGTFYREDMNEGTSADIFSQAFTKYSFLRLHSEPF